MYSKQVCRKDICIIYVWKFPTYLKISNIYVCFYHRGCRFVFSFQKTSATFHCWHVRLKLWNLLDLYCLIFHSSADPKKTKKLPGYILSIARETYRILTAFVSVIRATIVYSPSPSSLTIHFTPCYNSPQFHPSNKCK